MAFTIHILFALLAALLAQPSATSRDTAVDRSDTIKTGMILNFVRYTEWPEGTFASDDSPIVITILGTSPLNEQIEQAVKDQKIHGRRVEVHRVAYPEPAKGEEAVSETVLKEFYKKLRESHVLCIWKSASARVDAVLKEVQASNVLTISDVEEFATKGGMLGLTVRRERVTFDANQKKIEETKLKVSSQLLRLAQVVESKEAAK